MKKKSIKKILFYIVLTLVALIWVIPLVMLFLSAIRSTSEFFSNLNLFSIPDTIQWSNFSKAWTNGNLGRFMANGIMVCLIKVPLGVLISSMCAFALTRMKLPHSNALFIFILVGMMLPVQMALIPLNIMYSRLHLNNTYLCLIFTYIGFGIPLGTLVFRGFFRSIPNELDEAAAIDGCGKYRLYANIIMPVAKPAVATMFILDFLNTWNEFLLQSVLITKDTMKTVPNGLLSFMGEFSTDYGLLSAGVLVSIIPILIIYIVFQRQFVEGMAGAVKA
ncbi:MULTISPECIES: carbohydrate ABC transporter permease [Diplocloster]|nr:carbohydrate ABC transporter permease [Suonthocola fibrivorans]MCU6735666.1 carbohydrate ABC transporter permease [Suonthocola fibrivorans]SCJ79249.1 Maltose transport system permease protein malG [uncultured Clostridium sp.]